MFSIYVNLSVQYICTSRAGTGEKQQYQLEVSCILLYSMTNCLWLKGTGIIWLLLLAFPKYLLASELEFILKDDFGEDWLPRT